MRACELLAERGAPELVGDDRLAGGVRLARGSGEAIGVAHGFQEERDDPGIGVLDQQLDQLGDAEVGFVADRHQLGIAEPARRAAREQRAEHRAALRHEARGSGGRRVDLQHRVDGQREPSRQVDHAHAVRAEQAHAELPRLLDEPRLAARAVGTCVGKAVAVDGRDRHALAGAVLQRRLDLLDHDEGVIDLQRHVGQAPVGALAQHFVARRVHRHDAAGIAVLAQEALRTRGVLARVARSADQRDRARREQRLR